MNFCFSFLVQVKGFFISDKTGISTKYPISSLFFKYFQQTKFSIENPALFVSIQAQTLKRMKNHISDFSDFYFSSWNFISIFVLKKVNFRWIFTLTRKIKIGKIWNMIFFQFSRFRIFHEICTTSENWGGRGAGLHIHSWEKSYTSCLIRDIFDKEILSHTILKEYLKPKHKV